MQLCHISGVHAWPHCMGCRAGWWERVVGWIWHFH